MFASALLIHIHTHTHTSIRPTCLEGFSDGDDKHIGSRKGLRLEAVVEEAFGVKKRKRRRREKKSQEQRMIAHGHR